jgi:N-acetylglutamate synthase
VVALRTLTDAPVRTSEIRALEQAAAAALPGGEQTWLDGWLLRADSAVPLAISASSDSIPVIVAWYAERGLTPRLLIPDRLLPVPAGLIPEREERMMVRDAPTYLCVDERDADAIARAESQGFRLHHRRRYFKLDSL